jgi:hypothetical protein
LLEVVALMNAATPVESKASDSSAQAAFLQASFDRAVGPATLWYAGWLSAFSAGLAVRTTLAFASSDSGVKLDSRVGVLTLGTGLLVTLALTPHSLFAAGRFRAMDPNRDGGRARVSAGEELLRQAVRWENFGKSWVPHAAGIGVNVGAGLYLGLAAERWSSALVAVLGGVVVTELKIYTQPVTLSLAQAEYEQRLSTQRGERAPRSDAASFLASAMLRIGPQGVSLAGTF